MENIFFDKAIEVSFKNTSPEMDTVYLVVDNSVPGEIKIKYIKSFEEAVKTEEIICLTKDMTLTIKYKSYPDEFHEVENDKR